MGDGSNSDAVSSALLCVLSCALPLDDEGSTMKALTSQRGRSSLVLAMLAATSIAAVLGALAEETATTTTPSGSGSTAVVVAAPLPPPCPAKTPCKLDMGRAFGDPWVSAEAGEGNYFKVRREAR